MPHEIPLYLIALSSCPESPIMEHFSPSVSKSLICLASSGPLMNGISKSENTNFICYWYYLNSSRASCPSIAYKISKSKFSSYKIILINSGIMPIMNKSSSATNIFFLIWTLSIANKPDGIFSGVYIVSPWELRRKLACYYGFENWDLNCFFVDWNHCFWSSIGYKFNSASTILFYDRPFIVGGTLADLC